jgi:UDP-glucose 4-epimerase
MSILLTGGAGYIGGATLRLLKGAGEDVIVIDNLSRGHRESLPVGVPFYEGNVGDADLVARVIRDHGIRTCIHFAAFAYVGESVEDPELYVTNNMMQGMSLLKALRAGGVKEVVFSSTCATYGAPCYVPIDEEHPQQPTNPYGWSKLLFERVLDSYSIAYGMRYLSLRYFNAAGATASHGEQHDPEPHLIPNVLRAAKGELPAVYVFGNDYPTPDGTAVRDYIHISDLGSAHVLALRHLRSGGASDAVNLGNGKGYSVMEVIESAKRVTGREVPYEIRGRRAGDPSHLIAKADKARRVLGWEPQISGLDEIIESAWRWITRSGV